LIVDVNVIVPETPAAVVDAPIVSAPAIISAAVTTY
jgi:hypothetical protein